MQLRCRQKLEKEVLSIQRTYIGENVRIGTNCIIHPNVTIYPYTEIGDNVIVHANSTIGSDAFYYKKQTTHYDKMHSAGKVVLANDVEIGAGCTIDAGVSSDTVSGQRHEN
jgi:UDP-3-O-[3-hydroxymyristoyl] glucosamine N-acyltransferase